MPLLPPAPPRRPTPAPLELDGPRVVATGTLLWLVGLLVLGLRDLTGFDVPGWQLWMCLAGAVLGLLGLRVMRRRRLRERRTAR